MLNLKKFLLKTTFLATLSLFIYVNLRNGEPDYERNGDFKRISNREARHLELDKLGLAPNVAIGNPEDGDLGKFGNIEARNSQEEKSDLSPNIVHFVHLSRTDNDKMPYYQYLAIKAARVNGKAERVILHYNKYLPSGKWFELAKRYLTECKKTDYELNSIYGHKVNVIEHKKDLVELYTLRDMGGLFLDLDVIILKPIQDLLKNDFTLVKAAAPSQVICCFVQSKPNSLFVNKWIESYKSFDDSKWIEFCNAVPGKLIEQYGPYVTVLESEAAAKPFAFDPDTRMVFFDRNYEFRENYATHLWHHGTGKSYTEALSIELIWSLETSLFCKLRNLTADEEGAGVWTDEMSKDCAIVSINGSNDRVKGLIGHWPLTGITAKSKKAPDVSGNRMHGILSPMFGYKTKGSYFNEDYFTFNRGDHIYLPMVPEVTSVSFSLKLRYKTGKTSWKGIKNATIVCILFNKHYQLNVYASSKGQVSMMVQIVSVRNEITTFVSKSIAIDNYLGWRQLYLIGKSGFFTLAIANDPNETSLKERPSSSVVSAVMEAPDEVKPSGPRAIWLGKRNPPKIHIIEQDSSFFPGSQMADVQLFDYPITLDSTV